MFMHIWVLCWITALFPLVYSQTTTSSPLPSILPLAIKSPYLHSWTTRPTVNFSWPMFWDRNNLGWEGMVRIDNHAYQWLGVSGTFPDTANVTSRQITSTRTVFNYVVGPAQLTATFLSPIERSDPVKQSMPFSYVTLDINFTDGLQHHVQVYMDISGEWVTVPTADIITWNTNTVGTSSFHEIQRSSTQKFVEVNGRAQDMIAVFGTQSGPTVSVVVGADAGPTRRQFGDNGAVSGSSATPPAKMGDPYPVFTVVRDLGNITSTTSPVVFAIGMYRNPSISFITPASMGKGQFQLQERAPLYAASMSSISDTMDAFLLDFPGAKSRADDVDNLILNAAGNISEPYKDLVSIAARQVMAATELTIANGTDNKWNMSDVKMFMKDLGSSNRVNPVEKIYASFPFFLFINSTYAGYLLSPLLEFQDLPSSNQAFAARDIGQNYPQADGKDIQHGQQVEHSSSMLIMAFAHARISGDGTLISRHYSLLQKWAEYLVTSTMSPPDSTTIEGEVQSNSTNLVIKGIIALKAMSQISDAVSLKDDADRYSHIASAFTDQWLSLTQSMSNGSHLPLTLADSNPSSWAQVYNLYADKLLGTNLIDDTIYQNQAQFYQSQLSQSSGGLALDSSTNLASVAWTSFTAATISDHTIRNSLIASVHDQFFKTQSGDSQPFPVNYNVHGGNIPTAQNANPAVGGIFAPLALSLQAAPSIKIPSFTPPSMSSVSDKHKSIAGPVAGGVIGGLALIILITLAVICWRRRRTRAEIPHIEAFVARPDIITYNGHTRGSNDSVPNLQATQPSREEVIIPPIMSEKERQALALASTQPRPPAVNASVAGGESTIPPSSVQPPTAAASAASGSTGRSGTSGRSGRSGRPGRSRGTTSSSHRSNLSAAEVQGLRAEVENLRRFMQQMQVERVGRVEAPPSYAV